MPSIEGRLEATTRNLEFAAHLQTCTEQVVNILAEDQAKTEKVIRRIAAPVRDHEERLQGLEQG